jgi:hypothetical protein
LQAKSEDEFFKKGQIEEFGPGQMHPGMRKKPGSESKA